MPLSQKQQILDLLNPAMPGNHIPSLSDADEDLIYERITRMGAIDENVDVADLALRTCHCGIHIDGFYEFVDHLRSVIEKEVN